MNVGQKRTYGGETFNALMLIHAAEVQAGSRFHPALKERKQVRSDVKAVRNSVSRHFSQRILVYLRPSGNSWSLRAF